MSSTDPRWKRPKKRGGIRGLGDVVHVVAQPLARAIDAVAGTSIETCEGCRKRRDDWNRKFPLGQPVDSDSGA